MTGAKLALYMSPFHNKHKSHKKYIDVCPVYLRDTVSSEKRNVGRTKPGCVWKPVLPGRAPRRPRPSLMAALSGDITRLVHPPCQRQWRAPVPGPDGMRDKGVPGSRQHSGSRPVSTSTPGAPGPRECSDITGLEPLSSPQDLNTIHHAHRHVYGFRLRDWRTNNKRLRKSYHLWRLGSCSFDSNPSHISTCTNQFEKHTIVLWCDDAIL